MNTIASYIGSSGIYFTGIIVGIFGGWIITSFYYRLKREQNANCVRQEQ